MKNMFRAGAFALAMIGFLPAMPAQANELAAGQGLHASIDVARIKNVLRLTPQQARYWAPVEAALRDLARRHEEHADEDGLVHRVSRRALSVVLTTAAVERLAVAARPLIAVLSDEQKHNAMSLAQEMGLGPVVVAALN